MTRAHLRSVRECALHFDSTRGACGRQIRAAAPSELNSLEQVGAGVFDLRTRALKDLLTVYCLITNFIVIYADPYDHTVVSSWLFYRAWR